MQLSWSEYSSTEKEEKKKAVQLEIYFNTEL